MADFSLIGNWQACLLHDLQRVCCWRGAVVQLIGEMHVVVAGFIAEVIVVDLRAAFGDLREL